MDTSAFLIIAALAIVVLGIILMRLVFSIPTIVSNVKAQTRLMIKIAEKAEVSPESISKIMKDASLRYDGGRNVVDDK